MKAPFRDLPVAWLQLSHGRTKLLAAVVGILFADLLDVDAARIPGRRHRERDVALRQAARRARAPQPSVARDQHRGAFPRRLLTRAQGHPEVESVAPLYTGTARWKDPWTGQKRPLFVYGIVPYAPAIGTDGVLASARLLHAADTCLFDLRRGRSSAGWPRSSPRAGPWRPRSTVNGSGPSARPRSGPASPSTATSSPATRTSPACSPAARRARSTSAWSGSARGPTRNRSRPS